MNSFDKCIFLFSVVSKMSHSEINFPCPVPVTSSSIQTSEAECDDGNKAV